MNNVFKYYYIPRDMDLDRIASKLPESSKLSKDKLGYIINTIIRVGNKEKNRDRNRDGYVELHSDILNHYLYNYKEAVTFLKTNGVIDVKEKCVPGIHSYSYRIADKYASEIKAITSTDARFRHSIKKKERIRHKSVDGFIAEKHFLNKWIISEEFTFDYELSQQVLEDLKQDASQPLSKHQKRSYSYAITRCQKRDFYLFRDTTSGRYHSNITNLKSNFRKCFKYKSQPLTQVDITNCQPYLSQVITQRGFWRDKVGLLGYFHTNYGSTPTYLMSLTTSQLTDRQDVNDFTKIVNQGTYYEDFASLVSSTLGTSLTREEAKIATFQVLFSSNRWRGCRPNNTAWDASLKEFFIKCYPTVYDLIAAIKKNQTKALAILLQNLESYLIIDVCCKRIAKEKPECPIYSIHDSIATIEEYVPYVQNVIEEEFEKFIGVKPPLDVKPW